MDSVDNIDTILHNISHNIKIILNDLNNLQNLLNDLKDYEDSGINIDSINKSIIEHINTIKKYLYDYIKTINQINSDLHIDIQHLSKKTNMIIQKKKKSSNCCCFNFLI